MAVALSPARPEREREPQPTTSRLRAALGRDSLRLAGLVGLFVVSGVSWDLRFRHGQPFDIDESGYLGISLLDWRGFSSGGLLGFLRAVETPTGQAPVMTALTAPFDLVFGPRPLAALMVPLVLSAGTVALTFALARQLACRRGTCWAAALMTASAPVLLNYSRDYHFAACATFTLVLALYCLTRSAGLRSVRWSAAFGAATGLLPLARTMTVAFLPGLLLAAAWVAVVARGGWGAVRNGILAALSAVAVAACWLAVNGNGAVVYDYLTSYGYGSQSRQYGTSAGVLSYAAWRATTQKLAQVVGLPYLVLFGLAAAIGGILGLVTVARGKWRLVAGHPLIPVLLVVASGFAALTSSANQGSAFAAPLVPPLVLLTVAALGRLSSSALAFAVGCCMLASAPLVLGLPQVEWEITVPQLGRVAMTSGTGTLEAYEDAGTFGSAGRSGRQVTGAAWVRTNSNLADILQSRYGDDHLVVFGFRHRFANQNSVNLANQLKDHPALALTTVPVLDDAPGSYADWIRNGTGGTACVILTASGSANEFQPFVPGPSIEAAVRGAGLIPTGTVPLPDGRAVTIWQRTSVC